MHTLSPQQPPQLYLLPIFPSWIFHIFEPLFSPVGCSREIYIFSVLQFCPLLLLVNVATYITIAKQGHLSSLLTTQMQNKTIFFLSLFLEQQSGPDAWLSWGVLASQGERSIATLSHLAIQIAYKNQSSLRWAWHFYPFQMHCFPDILSGKMATRNSRAISHWPFQFTYSPRPPLDYNQPSALTCPTCRSSQPFWGTHAHLNQWPSDVLMAPKLV